MSHLPASFKALGAVVAEATDPMPAEAAAS
jgi:hypothetical protein